MQLDVRRITQNERFGYYVNFTADVYSEYRARLFVLYHGGYKYSGDVGYGITADVPGIAYDDWMCECRPPRIDIHKFNAELLIPLQNGENTWWFSSKFADDSESALQREINPLNILVERKTVEVNVRRILVQNREVLIELESGEIADGAAVTISNANLADKHLLGTDNLRICGTYYVTKISDTVYKYDVGHYTTVDGSYELSGDGYTASVWEVCYYEYGNIELHKVSSDTATFACNDLSESLQPNDQLCIGNVMCRVLAVRGVVVKVDARLSESTATAKMVYCPRIPSKSVPVNWPTLVAPTTRKRLLRANNGVVVTNDLLGEHSTNTECINPSIDTYVVKNEADVNHTNQPVLVCTGGENESVVCMQFAPNSIAGDENAAATLSLYVEDMSYSEAMIMVYQMDSAGWNANMSYDEMIKHVTQIPIGSAKLLNPLKQPNNTADLSQFGHLPIDDYHSMISIQLDSVIVQEWLSGTATYTPSIALKIIGDGSPSVTFASTNNSDPTHRPQIIFTGGESGLSPEPFQIDLSTNIIEPNQILRITPHDISKDNFGNSVFSNEVDIGTSTKVPIVSGNSTYLDVVVPEDASGSLTVMVYRKRNGGDRVPLTTEDAVVYVDNSATMRSVPLAKKLKPGIVDPDLVGRTALYNRDMGFVNMTEVTDETSLIQNVYSILLTNPGERLFSQNFGTGIEQRLFKLGSQDDGLTLIQECIQKVHEYEPRVFIDGDQSSCEFDDSENLYYLLLAVVLPSARTEMIRLPFKNRGRKI